MVVVAARKKNEHGKYVPKLPVAYMLHNYSPKQTEVIPIGRQVAMRDNRYDNFKDCTKYPCFLPYGKADLALTTS